MIGAVLQMIVGLGVVIALLVLLLRVLKRTNLGGGGDATESGIRLLVTQSIAPRKFISLVDIAGDVFALGIAENHICLLTKIENKEFVEKMRASRAAASGALPILHYLSKAGFLKSPHGK